MVEKNNSMAKYRIIEDKDKYGYSWYYAQKLVDMIWCDLDGKGWINQEAAMGVIRRDVVGKVVCEIDSEQIKAEMAAFQKELEDHD